MAGSSPFAAESPFEKPKQPAPRSKVYPPSAFASTWTERPMAPTKIGIRLVGEKTVDDAQSHARDAARAARGDLAPPFDDVERRSLTDTYNTALMQAVLVEALCDPDDVSLPFFQETPLDTIAVALPPTTLLALWEEYEQLAVATSPAAAKASVDELAELAGLLVESTDAPARVLRLARLLLDEMRLTPEG